MEDQQKELMDNWDNCKSIRLNVDGLEILMFHRILMKSILVTYHYNLFIHMCPRFI